VFVSWSCTVGLFLVVPEEREEEEEENIMKI